MNSDKDLNVILASDRMFDAIADSMSGVIPAHLREAIRLLKMIREWPGLQEETYEEIDKFLDKVKKFDDSEEPGDDDEGHDRTV